MFENFNKITPLFHTPRAHNKDTVVCGIAYVVAIIIKRHLVNKTRTQENTEDYNKS